VADNRDRLTIDLFRLGKGQAEGRYAIKALVVTFTIKVVVGASIAAFVLFSALKTFALRETVGIAPALDSCSSKNYPR
jgi:hypothetical protein